MGETLKRKAYPGRGIGGLIVRLWFVLPAFFLASPLLADTVTQVYQTVPDFPEMIWHYRHWLAGLVLFLLICLLLGLYLFSLQLRRGIQKRTAELGKVTSEYKDILDHMQDAYYRTNIEGEIIWVSLASERQLGYQREMLIGMKLGDLYFEKDGRERLLEALDENHGDLQNYEVCLKHRDGSRVWAEVNTQHYFDKQGNVAGVEGNVRNINERKKAEQESAELTGQLQQAQKMESIGVLAGGIAHDFNNLLVGVMGNAELAMLDVPLHSETHHYLQQIFRASCRGADLVGQMLAYSGQGRFAMGEQNINILILDVSELLGAAIGKQVQLEQKLMENLPFVYGDKNQLTQLIMNLMTNASDALAGKPGEIGLRTGVWHLSDDDFPTMYMATDLKEGDYVFVEVTDTGCGMDEETQARIFDPFFTTKESGTGLGLAALLGIVRGHHGTLSLKSRPGHGSCFTVYIPVLLSDRATHKMEQTGGFEEAGFTRATVLVIDDEASVRHVATGFLEREGIQVLTANDGEEGIDVFRRHAHEIALVILDLTMPKIDGEEAFHAIQAIRFDIPILLTSGFSETEAVNRLSLYDLAGFIRKPYTRDTFIGEIRRHLPE
jgi:PAS domain S-box-containing protein